LTAISEVDTVIGDSVSVITAKGRFAMPVNEFAIGELRHTSAGNIFRLERHIADRCHVQRVGIVGQDSPSLWDAGITYSWLESQWDSIPLMGEKSHDPSFGIFLK
jgi:hypothetical protein